MEKIDPAMLQALQYLITSVVVTLLVSLGGITLQIIQTVQQRKTQKRDVELVKEYATAEELAEVDNRLSGQIERTTRGLAELKDSIVTNGEIRKAAIEAKVEAAREEARQETKELRMELGRLSNDVTAVRATAESTHNNLVLLDQKFDQFRADRARGAA